MVGFVVVEDAVFVISDQGSGCQLVYHLCLRSEGGKELNWLYMCVRDVCVPVCAYSCVWHGHAKSVCAEVRAQPVSVLAL